MATLTTLALFCGVLCMGLCYDRSIRKTTHFDRFDGKCAPKKDLKIIYNYDERLESVGNKVTMNFTVNVTQDLEQDLTMTLDLKRCRSKDNLDTCEDFYHFNTSNYCKDIVDSEMWKNYFGTLKPKWTCPIKKGNYRAIRSVFDVSALVLFPVEGWFWKLRSEVFESRTMRKVSCVLVEAHVNVMGGGK